MRSRRLKIAFPALATLLLLAGCAGSPLQELEDIDDAVVDAEYSSALESIVMVGKSLWIAGLDGEVTEVELPWDGCAVSVHEDYAAVSHDGYFSIVDLRQGVVEATEGTSLRCPEVLLSADHVYVLYEGRRSEYSYYAPRSTLKLERAFRDGVEGRAELHKSGRRIYGTETGSSSTVRYSLKEDGSPKSGLEYESPDRSSPAICAGIWLSSDGNRLFNACGSIFTTRGKMLERGRYHENQPEEYDQVYLNKLPMGNRIRSMCDNGRVLVIAPEEETIGNSEREKEARLKHVPVYDPVASPVLMFSSQTLQLVSEPALPAFPGDASEPTRAEYAFCLGSEQAVVVVREGTKNDRWGWVSIRFTD